MLYELPGLVCMWSGIVLVMWSWVCQGFEQHPKGGGHKKKKATLVVASSLIQPNLPTKSARSF